MGKSCMNGIRDFQRNGKSVALEKVNQRSRIKGFFRLCPTLSWATGDYRKILIICPLFYRISCKFNSMSENKLPTGFIQNKLILCLNSYD